MRPALHYLSMRARTRLAYRGDLAAQVAGDVAIGLVGVLFLGALFSQVPDLRGWGPGEVLVVWGMAEVASGLSRCLFAGAEVFNRRYLVGGDLDRLLLRPLDPLVQVYLDHAGLQGLPTAAMGAAMVAAGLSMVPALPLTLAWLPLFAVGGAALLGAMLTASCAAGFLAHHRGSAVGLVQQTAAFGRYPVEVFPAPLQRLLTSVVPVALLSAVPVAWALGREASPLLAMAQPVVGAVALAGAVALWRLGLRRYTSSGS